MAVNGRMGGVDYIMCCPLTKSHGYSAILEVYLSHIEKTVSI